MEQTTQPQPADRRTHRWPLLIGLLVILGVILAVLWMSAEIRRTQRIRDANAPDAQAH